ncbi:hypothetical protein [Thiohalorhabdus denitrificans]|uniref:hypothetical protein n=1 Tax=Thiohalorhabdus denitrificans TaxID=381306 RepID=UPI00115FAE78|nr:hypothetical protein [Thiohalorhabdus denitrificans]
MKWFAALIIFFPCITLADTFLCVAEAGAVVEDGDGAPAIASVADVSGKKYILTKDSGSWVVKEIGKEYVLFNQCTEPYPPGAPYFCDHSDGYGGVFIRNGRGRFSITLITKKGGRDLLVAAKGRCSKIGAMEQ